MNPRRRAVRRGLALIFVFGVCGEATSAPHTDADVLLDAEAALRAAAEVTRDTYPDADAVWILSGQVTQYRPDGTAEDRFDALAKVLTEKGRRDLRTFQFGFNAVYGDVQISRIVLHKPDGTALPVDVDRHSRVMVDPDQMRQNIYDPNQRVWQVGVPGLEVGDVVRLSGRRRTTRARMPDTWADFSVFQGEMPVLEEWYEVQAPLERPLLHRALRDEVPGTAAYEERREADRTVHRWTFRHVPRVFEEPNMPPMHTVVQRLLLSTIPNWPTVSRWYWELCRPRLEAVSPEMREKARELAAGAADDEARLRAIFYFVAQNIRYMGLTTETVAPGYEPRDVAGTFAARYGVCRDKAAVLVAMLRLAGFEAFPVLISVGPPMDAEVPLPYFNHAIVAVRGPDGSFRLMDPTDETTSDFFPAYLGHRSYLVATPEGEPLRVSPVPPADENLMDISTEARLTADGSLCGVSTLRFDGINDLVYRGYFATLKPAERRRFFEGLVQRVLPGATLRVFDLQPADLRDTRTRLEARLEYAAPDAWIAGAELALPVTPWFGTSLGMVNFVLGRTGLAQRRFPLVTEHTCGVRERLDMDVSEALGAAIAVPSASEIQGPHLAWRQSFAMEKNNDRLAGATEFRIETVEFSPEEYLELKSALAQIAAQRRRQPIFQRAGRADGTPPATRPAGESALENESADVEVLEHAVEYEVADATQWTVTETVRERVLTHAGLKAHAEIKIPHHPAWESVELEYARVIGPSGETRAVAPHEVNLMDAPWVAAAPRYPPSKILVVNLPGVAIGHVIEYRVRRRMSGRPFFYGMESFAGHEPIARRSVRLTCPADLPLNVRAAPGVPAEVEGEAAIGRRESRWTALATTAIPREDAQPPSWALAPTVFFSHPEGAALYAKSVDTVLRAAMGDSAEVATVGRALAAQHSDRAERLRAIRDAVARGVRRAGPDLHEAPLTAVSPADVTWREGYGHSADAAVALAAMLAASGEDPEFVLAADFHAVAEALQRPLDCFQPSLLGSVLVRVPLAGGWLYLNDTDQYAPLGATPSEGRPGLVTRTGHLETIVPLAGFESGTEIHYRIEVQEGGGATIRISRLYRGMAHAARAKLYAEMTPEERRRHHEELVAGVAQDAVAAGELDDRFDRYPGEESFAIRIAHYAVEEHSFLYMTLPPLDAGLPGVRADRRATPLYWNTFVRTHARVEVAAPSVYERTVLRPENFQWSSAGGRAESGFSRHDGMWSLARAIEWEPAWFDADAYPGLRDAHRRLMHPRMRLLLLQKEAGAASGDRP